MPPRPSVASGRNRPLRICSPSRHGMEGAAHPAAQHVLQQRRLPAVMHRGHVEALEVGEGLGQGMAGGPRRIGAEGELPALRPGDELLQGLGRVVLPHAERQRRGAELAEEGEVVELVGPAPQHDRRLHEISRCGTGWYSRPQGHFSPPRCRSARRRRPGSRSPRAGRGCRPSARRPAGPRCRWRRRRQRHDHADGPVGVGRLGERRGRRAARRRAW